MKLYGNQAGVIKLLKQHLTTIFCKNMSLGHQIKFLIDLDKKHYLLDAKGVSFSSIVILVCF